jgi:hypothetical protein
MEEAQDQRMAYRPRHDDTDTREETWARALKVGYGEVAQEPMPDKLRKLLERLEEVESRDRAAM